MIAVETMTADLAPVDRLRRLPFPLMLATLRRLEGDLGAEAVAALRYELSNEGSQAMFWSRPAQRLPDPAVRWAIALIIGEYGTGKTWSAVHLFLREILAGRAKRPRIICASGPAIEGTIIKGPSGILSWLPPSVPREWSPSKGHAGVLTIDGVAVTCISADAPGQAIGEGSDLDLRDDVAKWVISCGAEGAQKAWVAASKSCREGGGRAIVPTTPDGAEFIRALVAGERAGVLTIDLGAVENNRGNLAANFVDLVVRDLRAAGQWNALGESSPFAPVPLESLRLEAPPELVQLAVAIDTALSSGPNACEVGIVGGGRDERSTVHVLYDASERLDGGAAGWPSVAWDLAERLMAEHPGVPFRFVIETNRGAVPPMDLLRAEERNRNLSRGKPGVSVVEIVAIRSSRNKCERARLPAMIAVQGQVRFAYGLLTLFGQLRSLTPDGKNSDRADAAVHLINDLAGLGEKEAAMAAEKHTKAEGTKRQVDALARMSDALAGRSSAPKEGDLIKVEGAPPGDARYPGPPPVAQAVPWQRRRAL